jgi:hypothetical protein
MPARKQSTSVRKSPLRESTSVRKSPLRVAGDPVPVVGPVAVATVAPPPSRTTYTPREMPLMMISEFREWLCTQTNIGPLCLIQV